MATLLTKPQIQDQQKRFDRLVKNESFLQNLGSRLKNSTEQVAHAKVNIVLQNQNIDPNMIHDNHYGYSFAKVLKIKALNTQENE